MIKINLCLMCLFVADLFLCLELAGVDSFEALIG
jgi:hypothetical protein